MSEKAYLAVDLGASSGRHVVGLFDGRRLRLEEVYRFENGPIDVGDRLYWDLLGQWSHVCHGLRAAAGRCGTSLASVGVDTWGVDFGLLGRGDELLGNPVHYRDRRTNGMMEKAFGIVSRAEIFRHTGLQFMQINTLYQLLAMKLAGSPLLDVAESLLMIPDLFHWLLTGVKCNEMTDASTSQFYNPATGDWATELFEKFSLPTRILGRSHSRARRWGRCGRPGGRDGPEIGQGRVARLARHGQRRNGRAGRASGPAAARLVLHQSRHLGTAGRRVASAGGQRRGAEAELHQRRRRRRHDAAAEEHRRLWLVQECRRVWNQAGANLDWEAINRLAAAEPPLRCFVNPDAPELLAPGDMPEAIRAFCRTDRPDGAGRPRGRAALRLGEHRHEVPPRAGLVRAIDRLAAGDGPHRRRRHEEPALVPVCGRRLRPARAGRPRRGHRYRQPHDASRGRRRRRLDRRSPRNHPPKLPRRSVRAERAGHLGRGLRAVPENHRLTGAAAVAAYCIAAQPVVFGFRRRPMLTMLDSGVMLGVLTGWSGR